MSSDIASRVERKIDARTPERPKYRTTFSASTRRMALGVCGLTG